MSGRTYSQQTAWTQVFARLDPDSPKYSRKKAAKMAESIAQQQEEYLNRYVATFTNDEGSFTFDAGGTVTFDADVLVTGDLTLSGGVFQTDAPDNNRAELSNFANHGDFTQGIGLYLYPYTDPSNDPEPGGLICSEDTGVGLIDLVAPEDDSVSPATPGRIRLSEVGDISMYGDADVYINNDRLRGPNGTAAAPGYAFLGDIDTGMYSYTTNAIGFAMGGSIGVQFTASDRVYMAGDLLGFNSATANHDYIQHDGTYYDFHTDVSGTQYEHFRIRPCATTSSIAWSSQMVQIDDGRSSGSGLPGIAFRSGIVNYAVLERLSSGAANRLLVRNSADSGYATHYADHVDQSSRRWKRNIRDIDDEVSLERVLKLQPRRFDMVFDDGREEPGLVDRLGFIAEEVAELFPEAVEWSKWEEADLPEGDDPEELVPVGFKVSAMVAVLWSAVQELAEEVKELRENV